MRHSVLQSDRELRPYQVEALKCAEQLNWQAGLFLATGTGKTLTAIRGSELPVLIICRRDDYLTWELELEREGYTDDRVFKFTRGDTEPPDDCPSWCLVTYDLVRSSQSISDWIKSAGFHTVIADELDYLQSIKSARTKAVIGCTRSISRRFGLTATPVGNDPIDLFAQAMWIDDGRTFGTSEWKFRQRYYIRSGPGWYLKRNSKEQLRKALKGLGYYVHEDDVLDLPPVRKRTVSVPMSGQQRRFQQQLLDDWEFAIRGGEPIELDFAVVRASKLRQVAGGFIYDEDKNATYLRTHKVRKLVDLLQKGLATKPKVVIWAAFVPEIVAIAKALQQAEISFTLFHGGFTSNQRTLARKQFRDDPFLRVFIGQADMGVGMNELSVADTAIWYSNSQRARKKVQAKGRTRRGGSEIHKSILEIDLVCEGSSDVAGLKALDSHLSVAEYLLAGIRRHQDPARSLR